MNKVIAVNFLKRKTPSSVLGLSIDGSRLEGVVLRRHNGSLQVLQRFSATLALDPMTAETELAGREILNHLQAANVRERHCVVALPLRWALAAHTEIPKIPEADIADFLELELERGFPTDVATLQLSTSRINSASGQQHATFIGIPRVQVERLELVLRNARLRPVSFSFGLTALHAGMAADAGVLALSIEETHVGLLVAAGGGVAALRALESTLDDGNGGRVLHGDLIGREARITLGQLPADLRESVKAIRVYGPRDLARRLADDLRPRFEPAGLKVEAIAVYPPDQFGRTLPADTAVGSAFNLAALYLTRRTSGFEFLPPKVSAWQRVTSKYAPGRLRKLAAVAALLLFGIAGAFGYQEWRLSSLRGQWQAIEPKVRSLESMTAKISQYRPWFDENFRCLTIIRQLTSAFPEDGSVTARTLEIRDMNQVNCSGNAENYAALIRTVHHLGTNSGVSDLVPQTRGKSPVQFSFEYRVNSPLNENR
ncbi:MAG TPA: hypothetical protein VEH04_08460 [Verrucomicrobiae bacterium]|nr:hypothetical protein [Verrucomicrobiae bacterium]